MVYLVRLGALGVLGVVDTEVLAVRVECQHGAHTVPCVEPQLGAAQRQLQYAREPARVPLHAQVREYQRLVPDSWENTYIHTVPTAEYITSYIMSL